MAERAAQEQKDLGSIPTWIQWDFATKYTAYLFRKFMTEDHRHVVHGYLCYEVPTEFHKNTTKYNLYIWNALVSPVSLAGA